LLIGSGPQARFPAYFFLDIMHGRSMPLFSQCPPENADVNFLPGEREVARPFVPALQLFSPLPATQEIGRSASTVKKNALSDRQNSMVPHRGHFLSRVSEFRRLVHADLSWRTPILPRGKVEYLNS